MSGIIGHVVSVSGALLTARRTLTGGDIEDLRDVRVGSLVKIVQPESQVFGVVDSVVSTQPVPVTDDVHVEFEIELLGEVLEGGGGAFRRGVSFFPRLGDVVVPTDDSDIATVYAPPKKANMQIGVIHQNPNVTAHIQVDDLLSKHFAVLGTTGSGKSCTTSLILQSILEQNPGGHIIMLDPHNEYQHAFPGVCELLNTDNLHLPYWLLNFEELTQVLVTGEGEDRDAQINILKEVVVGAKRAVFADEKDAAFVTVDTPIPYRLSDLKRNLDAGMGKLDKPDSSKPFLRILGKLESLQSDKRFSFMFSTMLVRDTMAEVISRMLRIPTQGKPVTIVDLSGVPSEIVDVVVSLICRLVFDFSLWGNAEGSGVPVLLVCEEAHRYAPQNDEDGFGPTKKAIARIAKEGRKYGVSVGLISQRPSELSTTILSQCSTLFALRMSNELDLNFVKGALPDAASGLLKVLPALHTQEAVVVGEGATVPMRVRLRNLPDDAMPRGNTAPFSQAWQADSNDEAYVSRVVDRWRWQIR